MKFFVLFVSVIVMLQISFSGCKKKEEKNTPPPPEVNTLNDGLVMYYPFSGNFQEMTGNTFGTTTSNVILASDAKGKVNSAAEFNGSTSWLMTAPDISLKNTPIFSISLKFFRETINSSQVLFYWGLENDFGNTKTQINFSAGANQTNVFFNVMNTVYCNNTLGITTGLYTENSLNTWHTLTGVYNGTSAKIYIDGTLKDEESKDFAVKFPCDDSRVIILGRPLKDYYTSFSGKIDEVRVYNRVLTAQEIVKLSGL